MSTRIARVSLAALVVLSLIAVVVARQSTSDASNGAPPATSPASAAGAVPAPPATTAPLPVVGGPAPAVRSTDWLNTAPLAPADLAGKVVLYDFWTFDCINCVHTIPFLKAIWARYAADGLVLLSIHSPEFDFEKVPANVADFVAKNQLTYPVALDPEHRVWTDFGNNVWPAFYLHGRDGNRRYVHFGEGSYQQTEDAVRQLLGVDPASPRAVVAG